MNDVVVVIRENQERTADACRLVIEQQVPESQIYIVNEKPFYKAVEETLKKSIHSSRWLIAIDADVLLLPDAISIMCEKASKIKGAFFFYQGAVLDKFFMGYRPAGPHLYNCKYAERALKLRNGFEHDLRPETFLRSRMEKEGLAYVQDQTVFGVHDFEQYYSDVYKKIFRHTLKHAAHMKEMGSLFNKFHELDMDFRVARLALKEAIRHLAEEVPTIPDLDKLAEETLIVLDLSEKSVFGPVHNNIATLANIVKAEYCDSLSINEQFLAKQRYFRRFNPYVNRLLDRLLLKLA